MTKEEMELVFNRFKRFSPSFLGENEKNEDTEFWEILYQAFKKRLESERVLIDG